MKSDDSCQMVCYALVSDIDSPSIAWKILTHDLPIYSMCRCTINVCFRNTHEGPSIYFKHITMGAIAK